MTTDTQIAHPRFERMGILWKLLRGAVPILIVGSLVWAVIFQVLSKRSADSRQALKLANILRVEGLEMSEEANTFLADHLNDPAFYSDGRNEHVLAHSEHFAIFQENFEALLKVLPEDEKAEGARLGKLILDYQSRFQSMAAGYRELGFGSYGLEGKWNTIAESVHGRIQEMHDSSLELAFLKLTRDEQDYVYSDDPKFADAVNRRMDDLTNKLRDKLKHRKASNQELLQKQLDEWRSVFDAYVALNTKLGSSGKTGVRAEESDLYEEVEKVVITFAKQAELEMKRANDEQVSISYLVFGMIILGELFAFFLVARSISNPIRRLSKAVSQVRDGNLDVEFPLLRSRDEVGVLANAFSEMIQNLSRTQRQLLEAQKLEAVGTLAGGIAHDFNNLLSGILAYAGIIKKRHLADSKTVRDLTTIEQSAERGAELTKQLLGYPR